MIRIYHLRGREAEERIDGDEDNANGIIVNRASPLEMMIRSDKERRSDISFPKGREGAVIGLVN